MLQSACNTNDLLRSFLSQVQALVPRSRFSLQRLAPGGTPRVSRPIASVSPAQATFHRPVFIVSAPRSGSTMLFDLLSTLSGVWTIGGESHALESDLPALHPAAHDFDSNRLLASDLTPALRGQVIPWFLARLRDRRRVRWSTLTDHCKPKTLRLLEKTPKNSLRIPFLHALFPDARFIYLCRAPQPCLASMMEGWRSRQFVAYRNLPGWPYREWSFLLVPNWRTLAQTSLATLVAEQWRAANSAILDDLEGLPRQNWCRIHYEDLIQEPAIALAMLSRFCELEWTDETSALLSASLPVSRQSLSLPSLDKWRKHEHEIAPVMHRLEPLLSRISALESQ
ncbi:MAG: sulfotransferase family protein [Myxococcota bacterium]